ncbi:MAG: hypothetical protein ACRD0P_40190, partial [Stackebrandtia sp.]
MKTRILIAAAAAATLTAGTMAMATSAQADEIPTVDQAQADLIGNVDTHIIDAMKHDFGLTTEAAYQRLAVDQITTEIADLATTRYGGD